MPRYIVERTFADALRIPPGDEGAAACAGVVERNASEGVTWIHSYVSDDLRKSYCVYDGPSPDAIRAAAESSNLPIDCITAVRILDPYFYHDEPLVASAPPPGGVLFKT
jgi:hypothetical protein